MPTIPAVQEVEIRRISLRPARQKVHEIISRNKLGIVGQTPPMGGIGRRTSVQAGPR
jgi:hypothetical protein